MQAIGKLLIGRYTAKTPITLFRVQPGVAVKLRLHAEAVAAGRTSFDVYEINGKILPKDPKEKVFSGPNGMSMRPAGPMWASILAGYRGKARIYEIPEGTAIPPELVLLHEHSDHYAMQPTKEMTLKELDGHLTAWLKSPGVKVFTTKAEFYAAHPELTPGAMGFSESA